MTRRGIVSAAALALAALIVCFAAATAAQSGYTIIDLGTLGGTSSVGQGLNASGQVTGYAETTGGGTHAFVISAPYASMIDVGTPGASSVGYGINDFGIVTGTQTGSG